MREHMGLYRGKRIDNGEWVEGNLVKSITGTVWIFPYDYGETLQTIMPPGDPDTVGECTGLRDKNGKLIFEGDIVLFKWDEEYDYCHFIEFVDGEFLATPALSLENLWSIRICGENEKFTVIGNIHDNPELLKGGEGDG